MKLAAFSLLAGSAAAYTAPTMTFSLGKKKAAPVAVPKVSCPPFDDPVLSLPEQSNFDGRLSLLI